MAIDGLHTVCRAHRRWPQHLCNSVGLRLRERLHSGCLVVFSHSSRPGAPWRGLAIRSLPSVLLHSRHAFMRLAGCKARRLCTAKRKSIHTSKHLEFTSVPHETKGGLMMAVTSLQGHLLPPSSTL